MALVGKTTRVEIPHEPGQWFELRRLSWRERDEASEVQSGIQLERIKRLGSDILAALQKTASAQAQDPVEAYDTAKVLQNGIVRWSYEAGIAENIDKLDETTAEWAKREILALNKPRTEDETKNG